MEKTFGNNIYFRHPVKNEISYIKNLWSDPDTMKEVGGPVLRTDEQMVQWFESYVLASNSSQYYCLIFDKNDNPVGEVSFRFIDDDRKTGCLNIKIEASQRRNGYARDTLVAFLSHAFNDLGLEKMTDNIAIDNIVSHKFFHDLGFTHNPEKSDHFWVELDRDSWNERKR